ncbi:uncharacterized protein LOC135008331 isoform X2 [Pseudophryne corroboree]|uniref:uncharacterized protein LOC135008331 isoform X2 n=1 Tax=Pseudophryne corroboree TaxID=495146 RepID=UPI0030821BF6
MLLLGHCTNRGECSAVPALPSTWTTIGNSNLNRSRSFSGNMESEGLLQCPYDKNHMIRPSRFPYHLVKCRENNKAVAKDLAVCPFNARHRMPKKELDLHMKSCDSKCQVDPLPAEAEIYKNNYSTWQSPPCEENWEEECSSCEPSPFILNGFGNQKPYSKHDHGYEKSPPRATYGQNEEGHTTAWKAAVTSGTRVACNRVPVSSYEAEWPRATNGQSQGGATTAWKPTVTSETRAACTLEPVSSYKAEWPRSTSGQNQTGHTVDWKPAVSSGAKAACNREPVSSYEADWPSP